MDLSIVIVNWNTRDLLTACLTSVSNQQGIDVEGHHARDSSPAAFTAEVFVVDNGSTDGSADMVRERFTWVKLVANSTNLGFAQANNRAIQQSEGCYVLLLNSDTEVHPAALTTMIQFMKEHTRAGGCGPLLLNSDGTLQTSCHPILTPGREFWRLMFLDRLWPRATYPQEQWGRKSPRRVEVIKGACFLLRRSALDQVGLLDGRYFMYTEEMDLCYRLLQDRWDLWWVPTATVTHHGEASSRQMAEEMYVQLYRSKVQFHHKYGGARSAAHFKRLVYLAYVPRLLVAALCSPILPSFATKAHIYHRLLAELEEL